MNIATYQATPEKHGNGYFFFTGCGHNMYSVRDDMAYHGCLCPACFSKGIQTILYIRGSKESNEYWDNKLKKIEECFKEDSNMNLINKVTEESYAQWIKKFVTDVLNKCNVECNEVIIEDIEFSKRVFLVVDGEEYDIRTWNFRSAKKDKNGQTCAEMVEYTLFKMVSDEHGSHGEEVDEGRLMIAWKNK